MRVLVTGGAGFIGSHLCERLLAEGDAVTCLDAFDDYYDPAIKRRNLARALGQPRFELLEGDIRSADDLDRAVGDLGVDAIVHLAARAGPRPSLADPALYYDVNVQGTLAVLEAARRHRAGTLVYVSSSSVYGLNHEMPFREDQPINQPASPYGASKGAAELLCHAFAHAHGVPVTVLRLFTVYGPRQRPDMALMKFAARLLAGQPIEVYGDGHSVRGYTYVDDVVDALLRATRRPVSHAIYNIGGDRRIALLEMIRLLGEALGIEPTLDHVPDQIGDVPATWADTTRAAAELGFAPRVPFEEGVARFCVWLAEQRASMGPRGR